jgi:glycosyltransferase involved in cell wall biosynthesis
LAGLIPENYHIMQVLLTAAGGGYLIHAAKAMEVRGALAGLWISNKNSTAVSAGKYRRCWPFHLAMKPFFHCAPQILEEKAFYAFFPIWKSWFQAQIWPECEVVQAVMGFATEPFDRAEKTGALKVVDCPNSHPTSYFGYWQRECDLWCPGETVPIPRWMFARMNRELERADLILCPSLFVRDTMVLNGIPAEKCMVNPFGVNTDVFKARTSIPSRPKFIAVGTVCLRKGFQYLFRAFEIVKRQMPEAELVVVGDYKIDFRRERSKWKETFTHFKSLPHPELAALMQTCTAFVFPSQEEGFARVISEAMGAGLPILASYESGATTLVEDGVEGFILCGRDPQHIAEAMLRVAGDGELCRRLGEAAYKKGAIRNTWQDYGDRLLAEYARRLN